MNESLNNGLVEDVPTAPPTPPHGFSSSTSTPQCTNEMPDPPLGKDPSISVCRRLRSHPAGPRETSDTLLLQAIVGAVASSPLTVKPWETRFMHLWTMSVKSYTTQQGAAVGHFASQPILIQHNLNFSAAKPNWPCSFTYMSLYTHAMYSVACTYEYETYGFLHDMLDSMAYTLLITI